VPVGVPVDGAVAETVTVKVTDWPAMTGFAEDTIAVTVLALFTVRLDAGEVLAA
jgi:uncharacterized protein YqfA (UPF0365 family)